MVAASAVAVTEVDAPPPWQRADRQQRLRGSATNARLRELCHTAAIANIPIVIHPGGEGSAAAPRLLSPLDAAVRGDADGGQSARAL